MTSHLDFFAGAGDTRETEQGLPKGFHCWLELISPSDEDTLLVRVRELSLLGFRVPWLEPVMNFGSEICG